MARPRRFTPEQVITALKETKGMITLTADRLQCDPDTVYRYIKDYKKIQIAFKAERERMIDAVELVAYQKAMAGEPWAVSMILKTIGKDRGYTERFDVHHFITEQVQRIREDHELTEEERAELIQDIENYANGRT